MIVNGEGSVIRTTYMNEKAALGFCKFNIGNSLSRLLPQLVSKANSVVRDLDTSNELKFIRLKTTLNEILIAPDNEFVLIVVQGEKPEIK